MNRVVPKSLWGRHAEQLLALTNPLPNGCWEFTGYVLPSGYGQVGRNLGAHRLAWEVANGRPVPDGLVIDHICHNLDDSCHADNACPHRRCVNPDHLEAVTTATNITRGHGPSAINASLTHCPQGHEYTELNIYYRPDRVGRLCRTCRYELNKGRSRILVNADSPAIRAWAVANGLRIADRGAIPKHIRAAYDAARGAA